MSVIVVTAPVTLVTPAEARLWAPVLGGETEDRLSALLAAAQAAIEPPSWLGQSLGLQTLRWTASCWGQRLPYGPVNSIDVVEYDPTEGDAEPLDPDVYDVRDDRMVLKGGGSWPAVRDRTSIRVTYKAGSLAADPRLLPAKHAIVLSALQLRSLTTTDLSVRSVEVPGVETRTYVVSNTVEGLVRNAVESLLGQYWTPAP